jgi:hypothetical protein
MIGETLCFHDNKKAQRRSLENFIPRVILIYCGPDKRLLQYKVVNGCLCFDIVLDGAKALPLATSVSWPRLEIMIIGDG